MTTTYKIGTTFRASGKQGYVRKVTDILKTYNSAGELVHVRYVAAHQFMGQTVTDSDVVAVTIARNLIAEPA